MNNEKERLRTETRRRYYFLTALNGAKSILSNKFLFLLSVLFILVYIFIAFISLNSVERYLYSLYKITFIILFAFLFTLILFVFGYKKNSLKYYDNFVRIGFTNAAGEAPFLVKAEREGRIEILTFRCKGCGFIAWNERIPEIQTALNKTIASIIPGIDYNHVIVRVAPPNMIFGKVIPWQESYIDYTNTGLFKLGKTIAGEDVTIDIDKMPMILIGGATGSGKTKLSIVILIQALLRNEKCYICDLKGLDFFPFKNHGAEIVLTANETLIVLNNVVSELYSRIQAFRAAGVVNISEYNKSHSPIHRIIVLIDECAMLLDSGTTKEAKQLSAELTDQLSTIARMGRAVGIHLIISTQRPDANGVPGSIKSNIDCRICGKADTTLSTIILGDGRANEAIPKDSQGRFIMADGVQDIVFQGYYYDEVFK